MALRDQVAVVRARRWLIGLSAVAFAAVAAALALVQAPAHEASARLFLSSSSPASSVALTRSYADVLNGDEISRRVVRRLQLRETPKALSRQIEATAKPDSTILVVTVTDPSAKRAENIANATAKELVVYARELATLAGQDRATVKLTVVEAAASPQSPVVARALRHLGIGLALGLLVGVLWALVREYLRPTVRSRETLAELTGALPLGTVPYDRQAGRAPLISTLEPYAPRVEAFRVLRTNVHFTDPGSEHRVIVVTSSVPGEGKTTTAANLALVLAQTRERVALLEGDLRRPRVAEYLGLETAMGLTTVMIRRMTLDEVIQPASGVDVVTSGRIPPNPAELIRSEEFWRIVAELRGRYDYVLIDAPPLLPVTDASLLTAGADGAILVTRHGRTSHEQVATAVSRVRQVNGRLLGVVLNMTPKGSFGRDDEAYGYGYAPTRPPRRSRRQPPRRRAGRHA